MTPTTFRAKVANRIKMARWRLGLTQEEAAIRIGLSARYFAEVERSRRNPTVETLFAIARAMKVTVADLVDVEPSSRVVLDGLAVHPPPVGRKPKRAARR